MSVYDEAWDRAEDAGLCRTAVADFAYDVWRSGAFRVPEVSDVWLEDEYGWRCEAPATSPRYEHEDDQ